MSFTMNQSALLGIALVIGMVLGLMLSGRGKYKRAWRDERQAHAESLKAHDARIKASDARIAELERARPVAGTAGATVPLAAGSTGRDDLSRIKGVDSRREAALNEAGYHRYDQLAAMTTEQEATIESRLGLTPGTITREDWRGQAIDLGNGKKPGLFSRLTG